MLPTPGRTITSVPALAIPPKLRQLLAGTACEAPILKLADAVGTVLGSNTMPFFPAYTDHGTEHVEQLLDASLRLIPDAVWKADLLHDLDGAVLVGACLLHDLAMHIREPGFVELVTAGTRFTPRPWRSDSGAATDEPWPTLWDAFQREARHFGTSQLELLFGPKARGVPAVAYQTDLEPAGWTEADRLLIGEFVRRHHARLAHEIAVHGLPGTRDSDFPVLDKTLPNLAEAIGAVARSHGEPLRVMTDYLGWLHPGSKRPAGALLLYHMGLLRVADYLQIEANRAPPLLLRLTAPQSPLSVEEWNKHGAVSSLTWDHADAQAIYIAVSPAHGLRTHLALEALFRDMQRELDTTHAVLSETYSGTDLATLKLARQRIVSNLDQPSLHEKLPYIPKRAALRSDADLFRLVVGDLYGNQPAVAGRELVQNAVDAVRARLLWEKREGGAVSPAQLRPLEADVVVEIEDATDGCTLRVSDRGIGMTPDLVIQYYLQAGASFGPTRAEVEELDHDAAVKSMRAGRFGVGAFSAFLLSSELRVTTRHVTSERGITFRARLDEDLVEIRWADVPIGTEIAIPFAQEGLPPTRWSDAPQSCTDLLEGIAVYYRLRSPRVLFVHKVGDSLERVMAPRDVPSPLRRLPARWRKVSQTVVDSVIWHVPSGRPWVMDGFGSFAGGVVAHNGILIREPDQRLLDEARYEWGEAALRDFLREPDIAVFDSRHVLGVTLQRYALTDRVLPFEEQLLRSIGEDVVAHALVAGEKNHPLVERGGLSPILARTSWLPPFASLLQRYATGPFLIIWALEAEHAWEQRGWGPETRVLTATLGSRNNPISWTSFPHRAVCRLTSPGEDELELIETREWGYPLDGVAQAASLWATRLGATSPITVVLRGDPDDHEKELMAMPSPDDEPSGWRSLGAAMPDHGAGTFVSGDVASDPVMEASLIEAARVLKPRREERTVAVTAMQHFTNPTDAQERLGEAWVATVGGGLARAQRGRDEVALSAEVASKEIKRLVATWRRLVA